jgi:Domain of unknown function (DUF3291)
MLQCSAVRHSIRVDDLRMADFTNNVALVNGIGERGAVFIWRYIDESGNATNTRPYADHRIIVNSASAQLWKTARCAPTGQVT